MKDDLRDFEYLVRFINDLSPHTKPCKRRLQKARRIINNTREYVYSDKFSLGFRFSLLLRNSRIEIMKMIHKTAKDELYKLIKSRNIEIKNHESIKTRYKAERKSKLKP